MNFILSFKLPKRNLFSISKQFSDPSVINDIIAVNPDTSSVAHFNFSLRHDFFVHYLSKYF